MKPGSVIGTVTLSHAAPQFRGARWLVVCPKNAAELAGGEIKNRTGTWTPVVYDNLGAGVGDDIFYVEGAEATMPFDKPIPLDAINVALLDAIAFTPPGSEA